MKQDRIVSSLLAWFAGNARDLPWRRTRDPYAIWVSEIMLQQTQVQTVLPYWERWMAALPNLAALAGASPARVHKLWEGLGYYSRARNLHQAAQIVTQQHGGEFPPSFDDMLALPGIGRYTAGAISSIAFDQPKPILDGNVMRVLARCFGIGGNPRVGQANAKLWELAQELVMRAAHYREVENEDENEEEGKRERGARTQGGRCSRFNQSLMELGALVCLPRQPRCGACPLAKMCVALKHGRVAELPELGRRAPATRRRFVAFVLQNRGRFLVRQRPKGVVNGHLWEFPNTEIAADGSVEIRKTNQLKISPGMTRPVESASKGAAKRLFGVAPARLERLCTIRHSITRYRITLEVFRAAGESRLAGRGFEGCWLLRPELEELAFAGAHKKILQQL